MFNFIKVLMLTWFLGALGSANWLEGKPLSKARKENGVNQYMQENK